MNEWLVVVRLKGTYMVVSKERKERRVTGTERIQCQVGATDQLIRKVCWRERVRIPFRRGALI